MGDLPRIKTKIVRYTNIYHPVRIKLGLTMNEYAVADLVYRLSNNPKARTAGWCYASKKTIAKMLCLTDKTIFSIIKKLMKKDLVVKDSDTLYLATTQRWYEEAELASHDEGVDTQTSDVRYVEPTHSITNLHTPYVESTQQPITNLHTTYNESTYYNKINNNKDSKSNNNLLIEDQPIQPKVKKQRTSYPQLDKVFSELVETLGFSANTRMTEQRKSKLKSRLNVYSLDDIKQAATNIRQDKFMQGDNDRGKRFGNIDYLLRSDEQIENWREANVNAKGGSKYGINY